MAVNTNMPNIYTPEGLIDTNSLTNYFNQIAGLGGSVQSAQPTMPIQSVQTPTQGQTIDERLAELEAYRKSKPSKMEGNVNLGLWDNIMRNTRRINTGLNYAGTHIPEMGKALYDYLTSGVTYGQVLKDFANLNLSTYNTKLEDFGKLPAKDIVANVLTGAYENPVDTVIDATSLGAGKLIGKIFPQIGKGAEVEKALAATRAEIGGGVTQYDEAIKHVFDVAKENNVKVSNVVKAAEEGTKLTANEKIVFNELKKASNLYDDLARVYSPETYLGKEPTAINQKILRDRLKTNSGMTYEQVRRDVLPYLETMEAEGGYAKVLEAAKSGDRVAKEVIGAKILYDKGRIFPITHGLANIEKTTATAGNIGKIGEGIERAGRFSNRLWGTASYDEIAKQLSDPDYFLKQVSDSYVSNKVSSELLQGKLAGYMDIVGPNSKDIRYLDRGLLEQGQLQEALKNARKEGQLLKNDIPVDKHILAALEQQTSETGALRGLARDLYQTGKSEKLATGKYLGANVTTGLSNTLINSGTFVINDVLDAIRSQGKLSKQLGTYRFKQKPNYSEMPILKQIQKMNTVLGGRFFQGVDRYIQNFFAEVAANAELRKKGLGYSAREAAIQSMDKRALGEMITDIKRVSLLNSTNIPLPQVVQQTAFAAHPFWKWNVTATLSSANMLRRHPLLANCVLMDVISNIGFDKEMQNRLNLGVTLDRPYVSFIGRDPRTDKMRVQGVEYVPFTTTLRMLDFENPVGNPAVMGLTSIINALGGKDNNGRLFKRPEQNGIITQTVGTKRFQRNTRTGQMEVIGFKGDEVLNTAINEFIGFPKLWNETIAPALAPIFSDTGEYYRPYAMGLFGSFARNEAYPNITQAPNISRPRSLRDVILSATGRYESDYYPTREEQGLPAASKGDISRFNRAFARERMNKERGY